MWPAEALRKGEEKCARAKKGQAIGVGSVLLWPCPSRRGSGEVHARSIRFADLEEKEKEKEKEHKQKEELRRLCYVRVCLAQSLPLTYQAVASLARFILPSSCVLRGGE